MKFRASSTRNSKRVLLLVLCSLSLPLLLPAQQNKLFVSPPEQIIVKRGATVKQTLKVEVPSGLHVNSDRPKDEFIVPLKLTWDSSLLQTRAVTFPKAQEIKVGSQVLTVFTGTFPITTEFQAPSQAQAGQATIVGKLHYQACNDQMCFRPMTLEVHLPVVVQ